MSKIVNISIEKGKCREVISDGYSIQNVSVIGVGISHMIEYQTDFPDV
jgi:hypothetical protein